MKIRLSYTILSKLEHGYVDEAIDIWLGKSLPPTPQMELGRKYHKLWETYIKSKGELPDELGGGKVESTAITELKLVREFGLGEHTIELVGVIDLWCPASKTAYDWKTGKSTSFGNSYQHNIYKLLLPDAEQFQYRSYNPYTKTKATSIIHLTDKQKERGLDYLMTYASMFVDQLAYTRNYQL